MLEGKGGFISFTAIHSAFWRSVLEDLELKKKPDVGDTRLLLSTTGNCSRLIVQEGTFNPTLSNVFWDMKSVAILVI